MSGPLQSTAGRERHVALSYYVTAQGNALYDGSFASGGRYQTYGQHSFILDFAASAASLGIRLTIVVEGLNCFPIAAVLEKYAKVYSSDSQEARSLLASAAIIDVVSESLTRRIPATIPAIAILHHAGSRLPDYVSSRSSHVVCMTENARRLQNKYSYADKCIVLNQGVDLQRFTSANGHQLGRTKQVLFYSRLSDGKQAIAKQVIHILAGSDYELTVLGDGEAFWPLCDAYGDRVTFVGFVPCQCIHKFVNRFDRIISSGRGVMEGLACGKPTLCAGFGYAGPITTGNIAPLLNYNLTGFGSDREVGLIRKDLSDAADFPEGHWRELAVAHLDMRQFVRRLLCTV